MSELKTHCPPDSEVLSALLAGGIQLCDKAIEKWSGGEYTSGLSLADAHEQSRTNYWKFEAMKRRMREIVNELKAKVK